MKFNPGRLLATPAVLDAVPHPVIFAALSRHIKGDWGDLCSADKHANERALREGARLLSAYNIRTIGDREKSVRIWIITEADRSATTVLLPSEY